MMVCLLNLILVAIFFVWMLWMPDSPAWFIRINAETMARASLDWLRPKDRDNKEEYNRIKEEYERGRERKGAVKDIFKSYANRRSFGIAMMLMFAQQFCGINCVIFNATSIFQDAHSDKGGFTPVYQAIVIGVVQVVATYISAFLVERAGRRLLMLCSLGFMSVCLTALGVYFFIRETKGENAVTDIIWLPVLSLCLYISAFSIGAGPIPWAMMGEIFPDEIKGPAACIAGIVNWLLSFLVTKTYVNLKVGITVAGTFWLYAGLCVLFFVLIFFFLLETRGKTFEDIHAIMSGENQESAPIGLRTRKK